jgi:hypothetical protein
MRGVAGHRDFDTVAGAVAIELAAGESRRASLDAIIHGGVNRYAHLLHPPICLLSIRKSNVSFGASKSHFNTASLAGLVSRIQ